MLMIKPEKVFSPEIGDILFGKEYLRDFSIKELESFNYVYWTQLYMMDRQLNRQFRKEFTYTCPYIKNNTYFWFFPFYHFTNTKLDGHWENEYMEDVKKDRIEEIQDFMKKRIPFKWYPTHKNEELYMVSRTLK